MRIQVLSAACWIYTLTANYTNYREAVRHKRGFLSAGVTAIGIAFAIAIVVRATRRRPTAAISTVLSSNGYQAVLEDSRRDFERAASRKLAVTYDLAATLKHRIESGAAFDVAILTPAAIDDLIKAGRVSAQSRTATGPRRTRVRPCAPARKPDLRRPRHSSVR